MTFPRPPRWLRILAIFALTLSFRKSHSLLAQENGPSLGSAVDSEDLWVVVEPSAPGPYEDYDEEELVEVEPGEIDDDLDSAGVGRGRGSEKIASKTANSYRKSAATPTTCGTIRWRAAAHPGFFGAEPYIFFLLEVTVIPPRAFPNGHFRLTITPGLANNQRNLIFPFITLPVAGAWFEEYRSGLFSGLLYTGVASRVRIYTGGMFTPCKVHNNRDLTATVRAL